VTEVTITPSCFIGCDVGKSTIVVFDSDSQEIAQHANDPEILAAFAATLDPDCLVVCEATGGYEAVLLDAVTSAGRRIHRADARKVKAFIRSLGTLGKSDAIDARALARYGQERHDRLTCWQPRETDRDRLHVLVATRRALINERTAWSNRTKAPGAQPVIGRLTRILAALNNEIAGIEADIEALIAASQPLARSVRTLRTIGGVGHTTACCLIAFMPELGTLDRCKAAALAGLAPHPRQSGLADRYRRTRGGRPEIKQILFMAALSAARHDPALSAFYKRLCSNGKKPLVALTAVKRKMIVIANARLRDQFAQQLS
jgi:transposase